MFVVTLFGCPEYHKEIISVEGIVYNEQDFNRYLDLKFPDLRNKSKRVEGEYGKLSISYQLVNLKNYSVTDVVMQKIGEVGQP